MRHRFDSIAATAIIFCASTTVALADDDLPSRVGRVSDFAGALYLASDGAGDWVPIGQNYPVTGDDRLRVGAEGRAEVDFGWGQLRLAGESLIQVTALDDHRFALFVASGRIILHLRTLDPDDNAIIDTPQTQIRLERIGAYRVEVAPDRSETTLVVREGEAEMRFEGGVQHVLAGQTATIVATDALRLSVVGGVGADEFDAWSIARDRVYDGSRSAAYVAREIVGAVDLDAYGAWENHPTYGDVWYPTTVAIGWAPYRFGRWVWCGPWGWTWVDDAPWGYAPFHYGRWVHVSGRWGWCPGARSSRPVWAPALVAWFGGPNWTRSPGGAPIFGWVPLAWGEPFIPHWRCSEKCLRGLNQAIAADRGGVERHPRHRFVNREVPGAVSAVPAQIMTEGKPVAVNLVRVSRSALVTAPALDNAPSIRPLARPALRDSVDGLATRSMAGKPNAGAPDGGGAYTGVAPIAGPTLPAKAEARYGFAPASRASRDVQVPRAMAAPATAAPVQGVAPPVAPSVQLHSGGNPTAHPAVGQAPVPAAPVPGGTPSPR